MSGAAAGGLVVLFLFVAGLGILGLVGMIVSLVDMAKRPDWQWKMAGQEKVLWIVLVILVNAFAIVSLIYWYSIRPKLIAVEQAASAGQFGPGYQTPGGWQPGIPYPGSVPPSWQPDPSGEHRWRWWDGSKWTDQVM